MLLFRGKERRGRFFSTVKHLYLSNNDSRTESSNHDNSFIITSDFFFFFSFLGVKGPVPNNHKKRTKRNPQLTVLLHKPWGGVINGKNGRQWRHGVVNTLIIRVHLIYCYCVTTDRSVTMTSNWEETLTAPFQIHRHLDNWWEIQKTVWILLDTGLNLHRLRT